MFGKRLLLPIAIGVVFLGAGSYLLLGTHGSPPDLPVTYANVQYGFSFSLPASWEGYSIVADQWHGFIAGQHESSVVEQGSLITIRHPLWTEKQPRQDIPIMIFTLSQWDALRRGEYFVGASTALPTELGRNDRFVFTLPANYNGDHPTGWEEVQSIIHNKPLHKI